MPSEGGPEGIEDIGLAAVTGKTNHCQIGADFGAIERPGPRFQRALQSSCYETENPPGPKGRHGRRQPHGEWPHLSPYCIFAQPESCSHRTATLWQPRCLNNSQAL